MTGAFASPLHYFVPICAGCLLLIASLLPWLRDPLTGASSAWSLPIDIAWQFHTLILSYGLLCLCCTLPAFYIAYTHWRQVKAQQSISGAYRFTAGLLCLLPIGLFLLQYLCADVQSIELLAQHKVQILLVQQHFGYKIPEQFISLQPFNLNTATLSARFALLVNAVDCGLLLPLLSAWLLLGYHFLYKAAPDTQLTIQQRVQRTTRRKTSQRFVLVGGIIGLLLLGRAPLAMASDYQVKVHLAEGNYRAATNWLNLASFLNPSLEQTTYFHIQRGQSRYFFPDRMDNDDIHIYLAHVYRGLGDYLNAYQELQALRSGQSGGMPSWATMEISTTLAQQAEAVYQQASTLQRRASIDAVLLPWLQELLYVDKNNIYARYELGRSQYALHNYSACIAQMQTIFQISSNSDLQSSAYTYIALSLQGQGHAARARQFLLKAIELDPAYHNNTAREELSGLH